MSFGFGLGFPRVAAVGSSNAPQVIGGMLYFIVSSAPTPAAPTLTPNDQSDTQLFITVTR